LMRQLAGAAAVLSSWLLAIASFYWAVSGGGVAASLTFALLLVLAISLTALTPWSSEEE
jgi:hypothetical protein